MTQKTTVSKLQLKPGTWRLRTDLATYGADGKRVSRKQSYSTFKGTEEQAEMERYRLLLGAGVAQAKTPQAAIDRDVSADAAASGMTVGEYAAIWLERRLQQSPQGQTAQIYKTLLRLYVVPCWGPLRLATLCREQILDGLLPLVQGGPAGAGEDGCGGTGRSGRALSARTVEHAVTRLIAIVTDAADAGLCSLKACDFKKVKKALPKATAHANSIKAKALSDEQTARLLDRVEGHWLGVVVRFALASGARRGEICALEWKHIRFRAGPDGQDIATVTIEQSLADDSRTTWIKAPKTSRSVRDILVAGPIVGELKAMRADAERIAEALGDDVEGRPVFINTLGGRYNPGDLSDRIRELMKAAGLRGFSLHSTRHTHASTLLRAGHNIAAVSKRLGHSDPGFTLRVYSWAMPSEDIRLAEAMASAMGGRVAVGELV